MPSGTRPVKIPTNQAAITAKKTAMPQIATQMRCGSARNSRKNTVRRFRCRSSVTTRWIGCRAGASGSKAVSCSDIRAPCAEGRYRSGAGEAGRPLLEEGADSFGEVGRCDGGLLQPRLERELLLE